MRAALFRVLGVDLTQIHGLGPYLVLKLMGECGTDMRQWPTAKHFTSWLALSPGSKPIPKHVPPLNTVLGLIARRGGFLARKHDGEPGAETIWLGLKEIAIFVEGARYAR